MMNSCHFCLNFAFNFNLRRYNEVEAAAALDAILTEAHIATAAGGAVDAAAASAVRPHRYCLSRHPFKPWIIALRYMATCDVASISPAR